MSVNDLAAELERMIGILIGGAFDYYFELPLLREILK